jgi:hypothetical protein
MTGTTRAEPQSYSYSKSLRVGKCSLLIPQFTVFSQRKPLLTSNPSTCRTTEIEDSCSSSSSPSENPDVSQSE